MVINIYTVGDKTIWIPVAKETSQYDARAFLPFNGLDGKYLFGYKSRISEGDYLEALISIQKAFISNESEVFSVKNGSKEERQYKAKWRHNRDRGTGAPLLGPTKGWVEVAFEDIQSSNIERKIIESIKNSTTNFVPFTEQYIEPHLSYNDEELFNKAYELKSNINNKIPIGQSEPSRIEQSTQKFQRDAAVVAYILNVSVGCCECCGQKSPFVKNNGEPYLEIHHVLPLADGGSDTITNTIAACPNCHRELHFGVNKISLQDQIYKRISRLKAE